MHARKVYEHYKRSIVKTVTYRILILVTTYIAVYFFTGRHDTTLVITLTSNLFSTVLYFIHERVWNTIHWGRQVRKK